MLWLPGGPSLPKLQDYNPYNQRFSFPGKKSSPQSSPKFPARSLAPQPADHLLVEMINTKPHIHHLYRRAVGAGYSVDCSQTLGYLEALKMFFTFS